MARVLACLLGTLAAVGWCAPAQAAQPRIIGGEPAGQNQYPAQGFLSFNGYVCGGSLVSNRYFLTAGHCATDEGTTDSVDPDDFTVTLGKLDKSDFEPEDEYGVDQNQVHEDYALIGPDDDTPDHDVALLRLTTAAPDTLEPLRLIESDETDLWAPGRIATVIGWGVGPTNDAGLSDALLEATVPMTSDADCADVWGSAFSSTTMVCAGGGDTDTCGGDSGGPVMVSDGAFPVLAALTSWGAYPCAEEGTPGVYTRLGDADLNAWVRARVPMVRASVSDAAPDPDQTVTFTATSSGPISLPTVEWDFDSDGDTDATGASVTHAYPDDANVVARVRASGGLDTATDKLALRVGDPPVMPTPTPDPTPTPTGSGTPSPTPSSPAPREPVADTAAGPLATIFVSGRPRVRRGRFAIRVRFASTAPGRTAVVEVIRKGRVIGVGRTKVLRGGTRRLRVKLTPKGRRLLARSRSHRLKLRVRVRVGRQLLGSRTITVRR